MVICWERLSRQLFTVLILNAILVVLVPLPFGIWGGMWNSIVSAPDHCLFVYFSQSTQAQGRRRLLKSGPAMGLRKSSPSTESTKRGEQERGLSTLVRGVRRISHGKILGSERLLMRFYCILSAISVYKFSQFSRYVGRNILDNCYV